MVNHKILEEWMDEQIIYNARPPFECVMTPIRFTYSRMVKAYDEIKTFANKSKNLKVAYEDWAVWPDDQYSFTSIYLKINRSLNGKLNKIFKDDFDPDSGNRIQEITPRWVRSERNRRYWFYGRKGRSLCGEHYRNVIVNNDYSKCRCPEDFKNKICKPINDIVRKYALDSK